MRGSKPDARQQQRKVTRIHAAGSIHRQVLARSGHQAFEHALLPQRRPPCPAAGVERDDD